MVTLKICTGRTCSDHGSKYLFDRAEAENPLHKTPVQVEPCACLGRCEQAINIKVERSNRDPKILNKITGPKLAKIIQQA